jgi:hypothetical protein
VILDPRSCDATHRGLLTAALAVIASVAVATAHGSTVGATTNERAIGKAPSTDPYTASLAYARCLRQNGVPHPDPDKKGDFELSPADERRLRAVSQEKRNAAENACFHHLKGLNLRPLSAKAITRAKNVLADLADCIRSKGYRVGAPDVRNLSRGRARFGLTALPGQGAAYWQSSAGQKQLRAMNACEQEIHMARRITAIINEDRRIEDL